MQVQAYLFFDGRCEEALNFYRDALGAQVGMMMRFKDSPEPAQGVGPESGDKIMHADLRIGDSVVMASDGNCTGNPNFAGMALTLTADDAAHAEQLFQRLSEGGQVVMQLSPTFFSPSFGMVNDRFGVTWMVIVDGNPS